jgi:hypothetical protein
MGQRGLAGVFSTAIPVIALSAVGLGACDKPDFEGAQAEVKEHNIKLDLPAIPEFKPPQPHPDGTHSVDEMRLRGKRLLGQSVQIKGYVLWVYDCPTAIRTADQSNEEVAKAIEEDPTLCSRPNFRIGQTTNQPKDKGVWVVENPRPPRPDEIKNGDKDMVKEMHAAFDAVPKFEVGQEVVATGRWELTSPRGFSDSDGLLVFESLENKATGEKQEAPPEKPPEN